MNKYFDFSLPEKVDFAAIRAAARFASIDLPDLWKRLCAVDPEDVWDKLHNHPDIKYGGAVPTHEPTGLTRQSSVEPQPVIAVDGSQIYPDPSLPFEWAYVQAIATGEGDEAIFQSDFVDISSVLTNEEIRHDLDWTSLRDLAGRPGIPAAGLCASLRTDSVPTLAPDRTS